MAVKITQLTAENIKRIRAVQLEPSESGLTVIGGDNNQGKTSVLDAICWTLGGDRFRPSQPTREGSAIPPHIRIELSNGLIVERSGKNGSLKVTDPDGRKGGQQLLNSFVEQLALDLPRFMQSSGKEKARTLLQIIGVDEQLAKLEREEQELYNERLAIGRIADSKNAHAAELAYYDDAPAEPVSASELIARQQDILARNGENARKRARRDEIACELEEVSRKLELLRADYARLSQDYAIASAAAQDLIDENTEALEADLRAIDEINAKVRTNMEKARAAAEAKEYSDRYDILTGRIENVRAEKRALLDGADMPLEALTVEGGELVYKGQRWDNMSGSEQLRVATAIVRQLNPECGFVLLDKLEQMDRESLREFGAWLEQQGLQAIATRVSRGEECSIIIEDGYTAAQRESAVARTWKEGEF